MCSPDDEILPGVKFGRADWVPTPAYWQALAERDKDFCGYISSRQASLSEEVAFCILGGYGIKMEMNLAAWQLLKGEGIFETEVLEPLEVELALRQPLCVDGRVLRYRFPKQKAYRLATALNALRRQEFSVDSPTALRDELMQLKGIGPKTASWIVRNWAGSNEVAILDVHVLRAGQIIGLFPQLIRLPRDYGVLERRFLDFAQALRVPASILDGLIWREMRILSR